MRQVQISLQNNPTERIDDVLKVITEDLEIKHTVLLRGESNSLIIIRLKRTYVPEVIKKLNKVGVGIDFGIIDILPLEATIPELDLMESEGKADDVPDRIALEEIRNDINEGAKPSFNHFLFIFLSAIVASAGLLLNSPAIVIASMIISPLMGPILGLSFGIITHDGKMIRNSLIAQVFGVLIAICSGILLGMLTNITVENPEITAEMAARRFPSYLDIIIAICAGIAVGFCVVGSVRSTLVGAAIALSLMPPAVNIGLALMYGDMILAFGSMMLLITNILIINICTMIVLKIKRVQKIPEKNKLWQGPTETIKIKKKKKWIKKRTQ